MDEAEIVKIFKKYYAILERDYAPDKQLTILAAAQLTNAHVVQQTAALDRAQPDSPTQVILNDAYKLESALRDIKYSIEHLNNRI